ncbi:MAG TPA: helix-turn-helix domain-containing protein [Acidimicrobiales bacterium]|nr:helix-turn-helix domain-containing protein [Acidimicrobiales bacterium]
MDPVKTPPRDRRTRQAAATRARIVDAAGRLFAERGYAGTTIDAVASEADVAVETVYARFKNKRNLLDAYLDVSIVGDAEPVPLLERPAVRAVAAATDQREQVRLLARVMRGVLERNAPVHAVLRAAVAVDPDLDALAADDDVRRKTTQRAFVDMLRRRGPLRDGVSAGDAVETMAAIANPESYAYLTGRRGWTPARYERWLADSLRVLLLPPQAPE